MASAYSDSSLAELVNQGLLNLNDSFGITLKKFFRLAPEEVTKMSGASDLQAKVVHLQSKIAEIHEREEALSRFMSETSKKQKEYEAKAEGIKEIKIKLDQLSERSKKIDQDNRELKEKNTSLLNQLEDARTIRKENESKISEQEEQQSTLRNRCELLSRESKTVQNTLNEERKARADKDQELVKFKEEMGEFKAQQANLERRLSESQGSLQKSKNETQSKEVEIEKLKQAMAQSKELTSRLKKSYLELTSSSQISDLLNLFKTSQETFNTKITKTHQVITKLQSELEEAMNVKNKLDEEKAALEREKTELKNSEESLKNELETKLADFQRESQNQADKLTQEVINGNEEIERLQNENIKLKDESDKINQEKLTLSEKVDQATREKEEMQSEKNNLVKQQAELQRANREEKDNYENIINTNKTILTKLGEEVEQKNREIGKLGTDLYKLREKFSSINQAAKQSFDSQRETVDKLQAQLTHISSLQKENSALKETQEEISNKMVNLQVGSSKLQENFEEKIKYMEKEIDQITNEKKTLQNHKEKLDDSVKLVNQKYNNSMGQIKDAYSKLAKETQLQKERQVINVDEYFQKISELRAQRDELKKGLVAFKQNLASSEDRIRVLIQEKENQSRRIAILGRENADRTSLFRDFMLKFRREFEDRGKSQQALLDDLTNKMVRIKEQNEGRLAKIQQLQKEISEGKELSTKERQILEKKLEEQLEKLKGFEDHSRQLADSMEKLKEAGRENLDNQKSIIGSLNDDNEAKQELIKQKEQVIISLQGDLEKREDSLKEFGESRANLISRLKTLSSTFAEYGKLRQSDLKTKDTKDLIFGKISQFKNQNDQLNNFNKGLIKRLQIALDEKAELITTSNKLSASLGSLSTLSDKVKSLLGDLQSKDSLLVKERRRTRELKGKLVKFANEYENLRKKHTVTARNMLMGFTNANKQMIQFHSRAKLKYELIIRLQQTKLNRCILDGYKFQTVRGQFKKLQREIKAQMLKSRDLVDRQNNVIKTMSERCLNLASRLGHSEGKAMELTKTLSQLSSSKEILLEQMRLEGGQLKEVADSYNLKYQNAIEKLKRVNLAMLQIGGEQKRMINEVNEFRNRASETFNSLNEQNDFLSSQAFNLINLNGRLAANLRSQKQKIGSLRLITAHNTKETMELLRSQKEQSENGIDRSAQMINLCLNSLSLKNREIKDLTSRLEGAIRKNLVGKDVTESLEREKVGLEDNLVKTKEFIRDLKLNLGILRVSHQSMSTSNQEISSLNKQLTADLEHEIFQKAKTEKATLSLKTFIFFLSKQVYCIQSQTSSINDLYNQLLQRYEGCNSELASIKFLYKGQAKRVLSLNLSKIEKSILFLKDLMLRLRGERERANVETTSLKTKNQRMAEKLIKTFKFVLQCTCMFQNFDQKISQLFLILRQQISYLQQKQEQTLQLALQSQESEKLQSELYNDKIVATESRRISQLHELSDRLKKVKNIFTVSFNLLDRRFTDLSFMVRPLLDFNQSLSHRYSALAHSLSEADGRIQIMDFEITKIKKLSSYRFGSNVESQNEMLEEENNCLKNLLTEKEVVLIHLMQVLRIKLEEDKKFLLSQRNAKRELELLKKISLAEDPEDNL